MWILRETYEVSAWFAVRCLDIKHSEVAPFEAPAENKVDVAALEAEKKQVEDKLNSALTELEKLKTEYKANAVQAETLAKGQSADALQYGEQHAKD